MLFKILVTLFGLLRKKAWNYGRLALLHKSDNKWMELFYGVNENRDTDPLCIEASVNSQLSQLDRGFFSWIITAFKITLVFSTYIKFFIYVAIMFQNISTI